MIWVWIMVLIGLFSTVLIYFLLTENIVSFLNFLVSWGAPDWVIQSIIQNYHVGFMILGVGILLYGMLHSTKDEPDTYKF